jgi:hypothetical protein
MTGGQQLVRTRVGLGLLIFLHILACCISLICVASVFPEYHIHFQPAALPGAAAVIAAFALVSVLFVFAEFSFGYLIGFYFYTMVAGYLWLNWFSEFGYDHRLTGVSAAASAIAFLLPALFIRSPVRQIWAPSPGTFDLLLNGILVLAVATVALGATYNFRPVALNNAVYAFRDTLKFPTGLSYLFGIVASTLVPFALACFFERRSYWRAGAALIVLLSFYPITLTKVTLLSSGWIVAMMLLSRFLALRIVVVLSLFAPLALGIFLYVLFRFGVIPNEAATPYLTLINFRMIGIPSMAMDYYNDFFSRHELTHFCQIQLLKPFVSCPYQEPLAIVIYKAFGIGGNFNASLFATEGIASVGAKFAPLSALGCGLVIAMGNRLSAGLPPRFVLVSGAILPHVLLNVPMTVTLLTHGAAILFLLWYITPRTIFEQEPGNSSRPTVDRSPGWLPSISA